MINLGNIELPLQAATKSFAILAKRGAGKSYTAGVMQEEFFKNNIPFVTFDPIDVHWGLRFAKDGKSPGIPVVVFGVLKNADIQLNENMGVAIAHAIVERNISCIISTFGMSKNHQRRLITEFSEELLKINNAPRHIFIEEAHEFVPQRVTGDMGRCFAGVEALVVMGRNRGLGVTLINQRAATINKDVLTQIDTLLAFRNIAPQDRKALEEWVEAHSSEEDFDLFWQSLPSLPTGEGWIWSPEWLKKFERIKIRERDTFHPDREKLGDTFVMPQLKQTDVQDFIQSFKDATVIPLKEDKRISNFNKVVEDNQREIERVSSYPTVNWIEKLKIKDAEIDRLTRMNRLLQETITNGIRVLQSKQTVSTPSKHDGVSEMWLEKIGRTNSAGKILTLLKEKNGLKLTKHQIRTLVGISSRSSGLNSALSLLKRNDLIRESDGLIVINPDIL